MSFELAQRISCLPLAYEAGHRSTAALVKESGLLEMPQALSVSDVEQVLQREPRLTKLWLKRASDQRISGGWGLDCEGNEYRLKNFQTGESSVISDERRACAEFIVRYVAFIANALNSRN